MKVNGYTLKKDTVKKYVTDSIGTAIYEVYKGKRFVGCGTLEYCKNMVIPVDMGTKTVYASI